MLKLLHITKDYIVGNTTVNALKGIDLSFRKSEFVSILGASGCGKTTMLNIVGGLDKYTTGDLLIDGVSTKKYKAKDWDAYRNHKIGFVFQNYNLIGHLTILKNVELALTLSGVSSKERKARATEVLTSVGLEEQVNKKPNQLSGGQMQRVAIARALVNNPSILLADEPTGALDSKTSVQIMEILKEISQDRLIIMVTHNPEIAEQYSTRIVKLSDGEVVSDSDPYEAEEQVVAQVAADIKAGSDKTKADDLAEVQAEITATTEEIEEAKKPRRKGKSLGAEIQSVLKRMEQRAQAEKDAKKKAHENLAATQNESISAETTEEIVEDSFGNIAEGTNVPKRKQKRKKQHKNEQKPKTSMTYFTALSLSLRNLMTKKGRTIVTAIAGSIGILGIALVLSISNGFNIYLDNMERDIMTNQPVSIMQTTIDLEEMQNSMIDSALQESDRFPADGMVRPYNNKGLSEIASYTNNLSPSFIKHMKKLDSKLYHSIDVLRNLSFHVINSYADGTYAAMNVAANGSLTGMMSMFTGGTGISFNQLVNNQDYVLQHYDLLSGAYPTNDTDVVLVLDSYNRVPADVLSVLGFKSFEEDSTLDFNDLLTNNNEIKLLSNDQYFYKDGNKFTAISADTSTDEFTELYNNAFVTLNLVGIMRIKPNDTSTMLASGICFQEAITEKLVADANNSEICKAQLSVISASIVTGKPMVSVISGKTLEDLKVMAELTSMNFTLPPIADISVPGLTEISAINIYPTSLDAKEKIVGHINDWNTAQKTENTKIKYTDTLSFMFGSFEVMLNAITYVLIAFVAISLIVSTVMIGIITYVSVIERTKEIGILRAIGARKKDISRVFNAETLSIGFASGLLGIGVTWLLLFPINFLLKYLTNIPGLAVLNPWHALILLGISMLLTFVSGLFPANIASKKDPILALRTE